MAENGPVPSDARSLSELARLAGYASPAVLRQAYYRGNLRCWMVAGRLVSTETELRRYLDQRPRHHQDARAAALDRLAADAIAQYDAGETVSLDDAVDDNSDDNLPRTGRDRARQRETES